MKKTTSLFILLFSSVACFAQISGYMGKRFNVSANVGFNMPFIGALFDDYNSYALSPRIMLNGEYQVGRFYSLKAEVGHFNTHVPIYNAGNPFYEFDQSTIIVIVGARKGKGMPMPVSSSYFGYGLGMMFSKTPTLPGIYQDLLPEESVNSFLLNLEWGRRYVFKNGLFIDGKAAFNLSIDFFTIEPTFDLRDVVNFDLNLGDFVAKQMATTSFFNLHLGVGFIL